MNRQDQVGLLKRLLHYVDTRTTSMADAPWRNDVSVYTDAERLTREQQILFRQHPIVMGFASECAAPGSFRTDDYAGVPVLVGTRARRQTARVPECVPAPRRQSGRRLRHGSSVLMPLSCMDLRSFRQGDGHPRRALLSGRPP